MSDSAPAKKVGSLRDRIAMFDKKPEADVAPAPASAPGGPRGKLGAWKPKPIEREPVASNEGLNKSEPSTTVGASSSTRESNDSTPAVAPERSGSKGMSAADARESITKGGAMSMKERMAALSGRGGFGGPPPPGPATPKSAFKRAPASHDGEEDPSPEPGVVDNVDEGNVVTTSHEAFEGALSEEEAEGEPVEKSEEELERERRAAIAARMARLGGTRVGIAPAFGRPAVPTSSKPARKPSNDSAPEQKHSQEAPTTTDAVKLDEELASLAKDADYDQPPAAAEQPVEPPKHIDLPEQSLPPTEVPLPPSAAISPPTTGAPFSPPAASQGSTPATSPPSMPIPAAPKRALPPRKKAAKATAPAATPKSDASGPAQQEEPTAPLAKTDEHTIERRPTLEADAPAVSELSTITISDAPLPESVVEAREDENHAVPHHTEARAAAGLVDVDEEKQYIDDDAPVTSHKSKDSEAHAAANLVDFESDQRTREEDEMKEHDDGLSAAEQVKHDAEDGDGSPFTAHAVHAEDVPALPEEKEYVEDIVTPHALDGASPAEPADAEEEDDASRRRRIAERLAKTGGVGVFSAPRPATQQHGAPSAEVEHEREHEEEAQDDEEDEDARRARIAERLARSGGRNAFSPPVPSAPQLKTSATEAEHQSTDVEPTTRPHVAKEQAQNPEEGDEPEPCDADYEAAEDKQAATSTPKPESALRQGKDKDRARVSHEEGETDRDKLALGVLRTPHDAPGPRSSYEDGDADDAGSNEYEQGTASIHAHRSQPRPHLSPTFAHDSARTSAHATTPARLHHAQPQAHMLEIETNIPDDAREDQFETAREAYSTVSPVPRRVASADDEDTHPAHPVARLRAAASESDAMVIGHIAQPPLHSTYSPPASRSNSNSFSGESPATSPKNSRPASPETDKPLAPRRSSVASSIVVEPKSPVPLASPRARSRSSTDIPEPKGANILPTPSEEPESESAEAVDDDADEEAARRQRIADKLIRMGGRNPLGPRVVPGGPRPARRVSVDVDEPLTEAPAPMQPQQTVEQRDDQPSPALRRAVPPPRSSIAYVGEPSIPPAARLPPPVPKGPPSIPDKEEDENEPSEEEVDNLQEDADATIDDDDDDPRTLPPVPQAETEPPAPPRVLRTVPPPIVSPAAAPFSDSPSPTRSRVRPPVPIAPRPVSTAPSLSGMSKRMSLPPTGALPAIPTPIQPPQPAQLDTTRRRTDSQIEAHAVIDGLAVRMSEDEQSPVATTMPHMEEESTDADDKEEELMAEDEPGQH
ncbi:hypothetical protein BKA62DRAFT_510528 [Auriculariales sp. MPI-PUGE-AT-0066]|nr:hypothetical protein BKA62DRAFT_510528 [Auriculariales sp. MPI-PUGE-AT-0066]